MKKLALLAIVISSALAASARADAPARSSESHSGMPRPFTSSIACSIVTLFWLRPSTVITSPARTEYDGMSTFLPFTLK